MQAYLPSANPLGRFRAVLTLQLKYNNTYERVFAFFLLT